MVIRRRRWLQRRYKGAIEEIKAEDIQSDSCRIVCCNQAAKVVNMTRFLDGFKRYWPRWTFYALGVDRFCIWSHRRRGVLRNIRPSVRGSIEFIRRWSVRYPGIKLMECLNSLQVYTCNSVLLPMWSQTHITVRARANVDEGKRAKICDWF